MAVRRLCPAALAYQPEALKMVPPATMAGGVVGQTKARTSMSPANGSSGQPNEPQRPNLGASLRDCLTDR